MKKSSLVGAVLLLSCLAAQKSFALSNQAIIDKAFYEDSTMRLGVVWHSDSSLENLQYAISWSIDSLPDRSPAGLQWFRAGALEAGGTSWLALDADAISFNKAHYAAIWLRHDQDIAFPVVATKFLISPFSWQRVDYFSAFNDSRRDTVKVNQGALQLWYDGSSSWIGGDDALLHDTIRVAQIPVAQRHGFIPLSRAYYFKKHIDSQPFSIAFRIDSLPQGYDSSDVRLYSYDVDSLQWRILHADTLEKGFYVVRTNEIEDCFVACIDTLLPSVALLSDTAETLQTNRGNLLDTIVVTDNILNPIVIYRSAKADGNWAATTTTDTLDGSETQLVFSVPSNQITRDNSVRVEFVANDGRGQRSMNLSRQIVRDSNWVIFSKNSWTPLFVTMHPDSSATSFLLNQLSGKSGAFSYDNYQSRLFRWVGTQDNAFSTQKWVEYSQQAKDLFTLTPGQVLWLKTLHTGKVDLGKGVTLSLKDTAVVRLAPTIGSFAGWTDFSVPYGFRMYVGDVQMHKVSNGQAVNNIQCYHWVADSASGRFFAKAFYLPSLKDPSLNAKDSILQSEPPALAAYCAYNPNPDTVELRFVPITTQLSTFGASQQTMQSLSKAGSESFAGPFSLSFKATTRDGSTLGPVVLGHDGAPGGQSLAKTHYPLPPRFGGAGVEVAVRDQQEYAAHLMTHQLDEFGGQLYELELRNHGADAQVVRCALSGLESATKAGMQVWLWDGRSAEALSCQSGLDAVELGVAPNSKKQLFVAVGQSDYFQRLRSKVATQIFSLVGYGPTPFQTQLRVRYTLPLTGISRVHGALFDMRGRLVMSQERFAAGMGEYELLLGDRGNGSFALASGMYLLRLWAVDELGATVGSFERTVTRLP
jgi:hypothetical protein